MANHLLSKLSFQQIAIAGIRQCSAIETFFNKNEESN